jgi:hypothetical protein
MVESNTMQTTFDIYELKRVTFYISPTHVATLACAMPFPDSGLRRHHYLLTAFLRDASVSGSQEEPCLIISSEAIDGDHDLVLAAYDDSGRQILHGEHGDLADLHVFERKAISLANERLATNFVERVPRDGRNS